MGLSQTEVAEAVTEMGYPLSQSALAAVEGGRRGSKIGEATARAQFLSLHLDLLDLTAESDDLAGMVARVSAEAAAAQRAAAFTVAEADMLRARADALEVLHRGRTESVQWRGDKADLLYQAFGLDDEAARTGLRGLGLSEEALAALETEHAKGGAVSRTDWRALYRALHLSRLLPNLPIVRD